MLSRRSPCLPYRIDANLAIEAILALTSARVG
jgi:hypothetical protein